MRLCVVLVRLCGVSEVLLRLCEVVCGVSEVV